MKKFIFTQSLFILVLLISATPVYAQSADVSKVQNFIQNTITTLTTFASLVATGFFVWGGFGYITSSGNPESLERSKKTILYAGIGLAIALGALVFSNIVTQLATNAFGH